MEYFLERIAKKIFTDYNDRLSEQCLVFPNRRAGLFFMKYLAAELKTPVWTPAVMTINDLFRSLTTIQSADNEVLLFELFKVYRGLRKQEETFDEFYFWGDMLLNDFDDIDKYLVDASKLFRNVQDLKEIDQQFGGLSQEQIEVIKRFWINFNPGKSSGEKLKFISIWSMLNDLYRDYKAVLNKKNIAYEGMIFRNVIEAVDWIKSPGDRWNKVHFIGFNAINECEKALMSRLKQAGKAMFYWDYDNSYIRTGELNSAGYFIRKNLGLFGNDMPPDWNYNTMLSQNSGKVIRRVIETSSDIAQVKLISGLIKELPGLTRENAHQTAVILADENLLVPVLTSLPSDVKDVNITMGYPLRETPVYSLIKSLFDLQNNARSGNNNIYFAFRDVLKILGNNLVSELLDGCEDKIIREINERNLVYVPSDYFQNSDILTEVFRKPSTPSLLSRYLKSILLLIVQKDNKIEPDNEVIPKSLRNEFIYRAILSINRLESIADDPEIKFTAVTWIKLLDRILRSQSVPFSGEPLSGIQIMGILETRTLDFKNLILLSVNEGVLPSVTTSSSFIPFSLREAFGLPSINHQESIYAYHFYRLLHRAENITFLYNSNSEGLRSGESSRFLQQMKYEPLLKPEYFNLNLEIRNPDSPPEVIERTKEIDAKLLSVFAGAGKIKLLSPSAINTWLNCRMKFYYRYVNDLREPEKISEEIDPAMLGTLLHEIMKNLYSDFIGKTVAQGEFDAIQRNREHLSQIITDTIKELFRNDNDSYMVINEIIARNVILTYIIRILEIDKNRAPVKILALEHPVRFKMALSVNNGKTEITVGGIIDRIDVKNDVTRIVDYKTGTTSDSINSVSDLFKEDRKKDTDCWLQTMLYCEGYILQHPEAVIAPSVYKIKKIPGEEQNDKLFIKETKHDEIKIEDFKDFRGEFMNGLQSTVNTIFDRNEPFVMTGDKWNKCSYCPYRKLCKR